MAVFRSVLVPLKAAVMNLLSIAAARVITSAALITIAGFGAFVATPIVFVKMIGIGLAVAVLAWLTIDPDTDGSPESAPCGTTLTV